MKEDRWVTTNAIKALREQTGAGIMDCKKALEQGDGDVERAQEILREQGIASAAKKASRDTEEGIVESYIHGGGRVGALVELNCETDFVARTGDFKELAHEIAMQVAAMSPKYVSEDDVPKEEDVSEDEILINQNFIRDPALTINDLIKEAIGKLGENIQIRRIARFSLGE